MTRIRNPYGRSDARSQQAKAQGYPARSVFKLEEIDRRVGLLGPGRRVLDLGACPGSWSLYASQRVGPQGHVVAVDQLRISRPLASNITVVQADLRTLDPKTLAQHGPFDSVLSDMAPATSGCKVRDQALSQELFLLALDTAVQLGKPGGSFVGKIFMGPEFQAAVRATRDHYRQVRVLRPHGTRPRSSELFVVGLSRQDP